MCVCVCVFFGSTIVQSYHNSIWLCRELNAHFYYYKCCLTVILVPDTLFDTIPCHIILTQGQPVLALSRKSECQAGTSTIFMTLAQLRIEPGTSPSQSRHSIYLSCAVEAGNQYFQTSDPGPYIICAEIIP